MRRPPATPCAPRRASQAAPPALLLTTVGTGVGALVLLLAGYLAAGPFLPGDAVKALIAAVVAVNVKRSFPVIRARQAQNAL